MKTALQAARIDRARAAGIDDEVDDKDTLEERDQKIMRVFAVTRKMFEVLNSSDLTAEGKVSAVELLRVLQNRMGDKF